MGGSAQVGVQERAAGEGGAANPTITYGAPSSEAAVMFAVRVYVFYFIFRFSFVLYIRGSVVRSGRDVCGLCRTRNRCLESSICCFTFFHYFLTNLGPGSTCSSSPPPCPCA